MYTKQERNADSNAKVATQQEFICEEFVDITVESDEEIIHCLFRPIQQRVKSVLQVIKNTSTSSRPSKNIPQEVK